MGQFFCRTDECICKKKARSNYCWPAVKNTKFFKFGLNIVIAVRTKFDHNLESINQKSRKQENSTILHCQIDINASILFQ